MQGQGTEESLVFVFSNGMSRRSVRRFKLYNLEMERSYYVEKLFSNEERAIIPGRELMEWGVPVELEENQHLRFTAGLYRISPNE